ncbi:sensor domain-containing diguanylate cyclase [Pseudoalteromonas sp. BZK2]|uniref:sensor domain-containing diguanylate cyclase n=1 Tax=Pseudoalteromonas sp. BZK2 TaxID=1904458 RepID=UPI00165446E8|nr:sensor domain-containing diguanylate cyclase [Pseudoalteromonas sp. BZK2]MBC7010425.1 sensor domain-containing diguanylate cyclase [Pseudoalteromonas sp. BZK2]
MDYFDTILANSNLIRRHASLKVDLAVPAQEFMWQVLQDALETLEVSRVSVWLLSSNSDSEILECVANTDWGKNGVPNELPYLVKDENPQYFEAIDFGAPIVVQNAILDSRTCGFSDTYLIKENVKSMLDTIIFSEGYPIGVVCCEQKGDYRRWNRDEVHFAELVADCCTYRFMVQKQAKLEERLINLAFCDELTGVYNRRYFFESINKIISLHMRKRMPLTVAFIDFDNFKSINDTYGHQVGDETLIGFTAIAQEHLRSEDLIYRFGGEEFLIVFQGIDVHDAKKALIRLQSAVQTILVNQASTKLHFTFSAGAIELIDNSLSIEEVISKADRLLYKAKKDGKNRIEI